MKPPIKGICFDFFKTLIHPRSGKGRGDLYHEYLNKQGLTAAPWEHQVLYDVFEYYAEAYHTKLDNEKKSLFWQEFTRRLFKRTSVSGSRYGEIRKHFGAIRDIFGPVHFELYPEVLTVLAKLQKCGYQLAVISNWQKGLSHFCAELGIRDYFEVIISSAEVGIEKPDVRIFNEASRILRLAPEFILHVGDHEIEDIKGAKSAGFQAVLLYRQAKRDDVVSIMSLTEIEQLCHIT